MIPATAHFIWFGTELPFIYMVGIRSAAVRGGFETVVLHHADDLSGTPHWDYLQRTPNFEARRLRPDALPEMHGDLGRRLLSLFGELEKPAARANLMRAAILAHEGGVYLDTDTITWRDLTPLRRGAAVFCGDEHIALPGEVKNGRHPLRWARAGVQMGVRDLFRRLPGGWRPFRTFEQRMPKAVNNAVFGCEAKHPFVMGLLQRMVDMPQARRRIRFALGTHLLQTRVAEYTGPDLVVHPPSAFYPLGPEVSQHWFRQGTAQSLDQMIFNDTYVIHWYASVRTKAVVPTLDPATIGAQAEGNALCRAAARFLDD